MTATITPKPDAFSLARRDPRDRLRDYELALQFYLEVLSQGFVDGIVFAENSNSDVTSLVRMTEAANQTERVEFFACYGLDYPQEYSRGYGEFMLLDRVMSESKFVRQNPNAIIWKVTGRYRIRNLSKIISRRPKQFDLYCHCRNYPTRLVDQYLLAWPTQSYDRLLRGVFETFKENETGVFGEVVMRGYLDEAESRGLSVVRRFSEPPIIDGIRGWDGRAYEQGLSMHTKRIVRWAASIFLPFFWI